MLCWLFTIFRRRKKIIISPRWLDILAGFANNKRKYGTGKSVNEALGDFMIHHQKELGIDIEIEFDNKPIRPLGASYVTITEDQYNTLAQAAKWSPK